MRKLSVEKQIIHVVESYGGGIIDFIYHLTTKTKGFSHVIFYGKRSGVDVNLPFPETVKTVLWTYASNGINPFYDLASLVQLVKFLNKFDSKVIHLHSSKAGFIGRIAYLFLKNKRNLKIIYTPNGAPFNRLDVSSAVRRGYVLLEKLANSISGEVICTSKSEMNDYMNQGIKASYINNGIVPMSTSEHLAVDTLKISIATIGRISHQKNPSLFNEIASKTNDENIKFIWIGDGPLRKSLNENLIQITGWVSKEKVLDIISSIDIYISTALWEGLPFSVLDAMNLKKPLLLHSCTGNVDLVTTENGFIFKDVNEALQYIHELKKDRSRLKRMGECSFELLRTSFNAETMAKKYSEVYEK